jgi:benzil reductase ((S)-benzoin forming)
LSYDLSNTAVIDKIIDRADEIVASRNFDFVCLVNNASATEPVGPIENCSPAEIEAHVQIGLITPMILTSMFMNRFAGNQMRKKLAFISSGAAFMPLRDESIYCASKAAINMFAQCIGLEQQDTEYGFEVVSIGPGLVDTTMQLAIRSKSNDEFAMAAFFKQAFEEGRLQEPAEVAKEFTGFWRTDTSRAYMLMQAGTRAFNRPLRYLTNYVVHCIC